ncbi:MAG: S8 family serine peptidase [Chitinophagaceae bacterium]
MAKTKRSGTRRANTGANVAGSISSPVDEMLLAALEGGGDSFETGRFLVTLKEGAGEQGLQSLGAQGMRMADARDFKDQAAVLETVGDADGVYFPEIGVALISGNAAKQRSMNVQMEIAADSPVESIDPEYFVFANNNPSEFLRGFLKATEVITNEIGEGRQTDEDTDEEASVLGVTWGLKACKVPPGIRSGSGIKVAVLDTGMDLGHPDFAGRAIVGATFVGQPVQDLHGHGTHCIGTACGPKAPAGAIPRYGIGHKTRIFVGKVLSNSGNGSQAGVLAGMNWAIANRCQVISMSLGSQSPVHPAYTAAGQAALNNGCLIVAAAGNSSGPTGSPANSPTIMSVASLDLNLQPSSFSNFGKVEIAAPGRDVFSSWPRPVKYKTISGTSMATPHVAGCAALWAETSANLRGLTLWRKLQATAKRLPFPASRVGAGLVQAP